MPRRVSLCLALAALWTVSRLWDVLLIKALPWTPYDITLYAHWAAGLRSGSFPIGDAQWQYPDLTAVLLLVPTIAPSYLVGFLLLALVADIVLMILICVRSWRGASWLGPLMWAAAGLWVGPVLLLRLDIFPTLLAAAALLLLHRPVVSSILSALGAGLKVWPVVNLVGLPARALPKALVAFVLSLLTGITLLRWLIPAGDTFLAAQVGRGLHAESLGAIPYLAGVFWGSPPRLQMSNGTLEVVTTQGWLIGLITTAAGLMIVGIIAVAHWRERLHRAPAVDVVTACLIVLVTTGRVFSPQYYVWIAGVGAVALLARGTRMRAPLLIVLVSAVVAQAVYPLHIGWEQLQPVAVGAQLLRVSLMIVASVWSLARLLRAPKVVACATS